MNRPPGLYLNFWKKKDMSESTYSRYKYLAGTDEVGRGPLAGPVVAAAVILDNDKPVAGLMDSKKLTHKKRLALAEAIKTNAIAWAIGRAEVEEIDRINILKASLLAMKRAIEVLNVKPEIVLVDGNYVPDVAYPSEAIIKGDSLIPAISAASIIAKVERDMEMIEMDAAYPGYGFSSHKGYPTKQHLTALEKLGVTKIHRRSFTPVKKFIN